MSYKYVYMKKKIVVDGIALRWGEGADEAGGLAEHVSPVLDTPEINGSGLCTTSHFGLGLFQNLKLSVVDGIV